MTGRPAVKQGSALEAFWTVTELSSLIKVAPTIIYDWVHEGFIPHVKLGRCVRFRPSEVMVWLDRHANPGRSQRVPEVEV
jgi:excisionase family DNA binding protein